MLSFAGVNYMIVNAWKPVYHYRRRLSSGYPSWELCPDYEPLNPRLLFWLGENKQVFIRLPRHFTDEKPIPAHVLFPRLSPMPVDDLPEELTFY